MEIKEFQQKLQDIQRLAVNNGRKISREVVEDFFAGDGLNETQLQKVYDYLTIQGIHTDEEKKKAEKVSEPEMPKKSSMFSYEAEEAEEEKKSAELTQEEKEYLEDYLETLNVILPEEDVFLNQQKQERHRQNQD